MNNCKQGGTCHGDLKKQNAITLIALVITIIVLLILAGISLSLIMGEGGILTRATNAVKTNNLAGAQEKVELLVAEYAYDYLQEKYVNVTITEDKATYILTQLRQYASNNNSKIEECGLSVDGTTVLISSEGKTITGTIGESGSITWEGEVTGLNISSNLSIKEGKTVALTVAKSGDAEDKAVSWSATGNVTFVTSLTDATEVESPTGDTVYIKAGAYSNGTSGTVTVSATGEVSKICNVTITEGIASATLTGPSTVQTGKTSTTLLAVTGTTTGSTQTALTSGVTFNQTSSDGGTVTINAETGAVTGSTVGTVSVTATVDGSLTNTGNSITTSAITIEVQEPQFVLGEPAANSASNYGKKVIDYKSNAESSQDEIGWRVFYQDTEGNTYLIADKLIGSYTPQNSWGSHTGANTSAQGKGLNPLVKDLLTSLSSNSNMKATSWFTDPTVWSTYTDSNTNNKATFAIASPTIELYVKSYNAVAAINSKVEAVSYPTVGSLGYSLSISGLTTGVNGIYNKGSENDWWLASPYSGNYNSRLCLYVSGALNTVNSTLEDHALEVRPIVCIPTSEIGSTYHLES